MGILSLGVDSLPDLWSTVGMATTASLRITTPGAVTYWPGEAAQFAVAALGVDVAVAVPFGTVPVPVERPAAHREVAVLTGAPSDLDAVLAHGMLRPFVVAVPVLFA